MRQQAWEVSSVAGCKNQLVIGTNEKLILNDKELKDVLSYEIKHSAGKTAELTVTMEVTINQAVSE